MIVAVVRREVFALLLDAVSKRVARKKQIRCAYAPGRVEMKFRNGPKNLQKSFFSTVRWQCNKCVTKMRESSKTREKTLSPAGSRVGQFASKNFAKVVFLMRTARQCNKMPEDARELEDARKRSRFGPTDTPPHRRASQTSIHLSLDAATATWRGSVGN